MVTINACPTDHPSEQRAAGVPTEIAEVASEVAVEAVAVGRAGQSQPAPRRVRLAIAAARSAAELVRLNTEPGNLGTDPADRAAHAANEAPTLWRR